MTNPTPAAPPPSKNPPGSTGKQAIKPKSYGASTLKIVLTATSIAATIGGWGLISATAPEMKAEFGDAAVAQAQTTATPTSRPTNTTVPTPTTQNRAQNQTQAPAATVAPKATAVPTVRPQATATPQARVQPAPRARTRSSR
ncbi:MAG TPA: hypothetical protein PLJ62_02825 [Thermoflexales bacterium]|nr:hypothetical protein [Thermoflexales bacterium]HQW34750.1 hypothetical protein [Thermoflexales bacterium]HQZ23118.1 hypothetical protein [Thermoflexales bacterium]HQZ99107.1 hypothetical protein [Thermoflexales bacterium]